VSVSSIVKGLTKRPDVESLVRHFAFTFAAVYLLAAGPIVAHAANDLVAGQVVSGSDGKALGVAAIAAAGTSILRVVVPAIASLALKASAAAKQ